MTIRLHTITENPPKIFKNQFCANYLAISFHTYTSENVVRMIANLLPVTCLIIWLSLGPTFWMSIFTTWPKVSGHLNIIPLCGCWTLISKPWALTCCYNGFSQGLALMLGEKHCLTTIQPNCVCFLYGSGFVNGDVAMSKLERTIPKQAVYSWGIKGLKRRNGDKK